jgi:two-component system LytT family response regulator
MGLQSFVTHMIPETPIARIPVRANGKIAFVRLEDVDWIEADGNYLRLHVAGEVHRVRETMDRMHQRLAGTSFARIHRSTIVNVERVIEVEPWYTGEYVVRLSTGEELTLTRTYRDAFFALCGR